MVISDTRVEEAREREAARERERLKERAERRGRSEDSDVTREVECQTDSPAALSACQCSKCERRDRLEETEGRSAGGL